MYCMSLVQPNQHNWLNCNRSCGYWPGEINTRPSIILDIIILEVIICEASWEPNFIVKSVCLTLCIASPYHWIDAKLWTLKISNIVYFQSWGGQIEYKMAHFYFYKHLEFVNHTCSVFYRHFTEPCSWTACYTVSMVWGILSQSWNWNLYTRVYLRYGDFILVYPTFYHCNVVWCNRCCIFGSKLRKQLDDVTLAG